MKSDMQNSVYYHLPSDLQCLAHWLVSSRWLLCICWKKERCLQWWDTWDESWRKIIAVVQAQKGRESIKHTGCVDTRSKSSNTSNGTKECDGRSDRHEVATAGLCKQMKAKSLTSPRSETPKSFTWKVYL